MRKYQKTQCLETFKLISEIHNEIVKYIEKRQLAEALVFLEQCQQGAIGIGTLVDIAEGRDTETVRYLEEYCELIYQIYENLQQGVLIDTWKLRKKLKKSLMKAENSLRDIRIQWEVVFLPYNASMWDSLESVWKAVSEDSDCTALVIPIPYFDKNPDGSIREMHYEIDRFPLEVPVIEYGAYDFEARHPDVIFIHNSYDDGNYVTSVLPCFFSKNLKRYTDELVYIPYFILGEIQPSDQAVVERMENFCITAGVINADHVIVQSEAMRQIYVDVLTKYTSEKERPYWEKKILGLGSPKFDRVCSLRREDFDLPEGWKRLIQKEDGSRKKVIFYNTSINAMLKNEEAMLEKMRENFQIFREVREDITLLWRPHPLMAATISSMRPSLHQRYMEMVEEYKASDFGIYDDSADMNRAIAISDAYYGDWSSVVWLYKQTGKPIMIQHIAFKTDVI